MAQSVRSAGVPPRGVCLQVRWFDWGFAVTRDTEVWPAHLVFEPSRLSRSELYTSHVIVL